MSKEYISIFKPQVARKLLKLGNQIYQLQEGINGVISTYKIKL